MQPNKLAARSVRYNMPITMQIKHCIHLPNFLQDSNDVHNNNDNTDNNNNYPVYITLVYTESL